MAQRPALLCCLQSLQWVYGLSNVPCNIINLSDEHNDRVVYAAAHTAVIYDKRTRKQTFLQVQQTSHAVLHTMCAYHDKLKVSLSLSLLW